METITLLVDPPGVSCIVPEGPVVGVGEVGAVVLVEFLEKCGKRSKGLVVNVAQPNLSKIILIKELVIEITERN